MYLARSGKARGVRASSKARNVHAPARRLARTTISLGPEEGIIFGLRAIRSAALCTQQASVDLRLSCSKPGGRDLGCGTYKVGCSVSGRTGRVEKKWHVQGWVICQWTHRKGCLQTQAQCSSGQDKL